MRAINYLGLKNVLLLRREAAQWPLINASNVNIEFVSDSEIVNRNINLGGSFTYDLDSASFANIYSSGALNLSQTSQYDFKLRNTIFE